MQDRLIIFSLNIASSYVGNKETPKETTPDTLQFYAHESRIWRIRTYALDHDIHVHQINMKGRTVDETLEFLKSSSKEHYGDVLDREYTLELENSADTKTADQYFTEQGLHAELSSMGEFAYWNPDGQAYVNKSNPLG